MENEIHGTCFAGNLLIILKHHYLDHLSPDASAENFYAAQTLCNIRQANTAY